MLVIGSNLLHHRPQSPLATVRSPSFFSRDSRKHIPTLHLTHLNNPQKRGRRMLLLSSFDQRGRHYVQTLIPPSESARDTALLFGVRCSLL